MLFQVGCIVLGTIALYWAWRDHRSSQRAVAWQKLADETKKTLDEAVAEFDTVLQANLRDFDEARAEFDATYKALLQDFEAYGAQVVREFEALYGRAARAEQECRELQEQLSALRR